MMQVTENGRVSVCCDAATKPLATPVPSEVVYGKTRNGGGGCNLWNKDCCPRASGRGEGEVDAKGPRAAGSAFQRSHIKEEHTGKQGVSRKQGRRKE
jgi:hypothetical protein